MVSYKSDVQLLAEFHFGVADVLNLSVSEAVKFSGELCEEIKRVIIYRTNYLGQEIKLKLITIFEDLYKWNSGRMRLATLRSKLEKNGVQLREFSTPSITFYDPFPIIKEFQARTCTPRYDTVPLPPSPPLTPCDRVINSFSPGIDPCLSTSSINKQCLSSNEEQPLESLNSFTSEDYNKDKKNFHTIDETLMTGCLYGWPTSITSSVWTDLQNIANYSGCKVMLLYEHLETPYLFLTADREWDIRKCIDFLREFKMENQCPVTQQPDSPATSAEPPTTNHITYDRSLLLKIKRMQTSGNNSLISQLVEKTKEYDIMLL